ncbi:MAG: hypothetical protein FRX49_04255 [Trebouxia sp. A1-2]|nr:MAG: hypothetical protein FRX49_04255 [Trebouxia sp. A1-2]
MSSRKVNVCTHDSKANGVELLVDVLPALLPLKRLPKSAPIARPVLLPMLVAAVVPLPVTAPLAPLISSCSAAELSPTSPAVPADAAELVADSVANLSTPNADALLTRAVADSSGFGLLAGGCLALPILLDLLLLYDWCMQNLSRLSAANKLKVKQSTDHARLQLRAPEKQLACDQHSEAWKLTPGTPSAAAACATAYMLYNQGKGCCKGTASNALLICCRRSDTKVGVKMCLKEGWLWGSLTYGRA